ncbi:hypothetical protein LTR10_013879 [Elasticomyces elasticus]|nr:hypothetical protein LTR10_013879 [Elasticomyces elasticus]
MSLISRFMTLPPEMRLDIYERVLRFDCPIRRIKPIEELDGTLDDDLRQFVRGGPADISILFACRKTFDEALPILYKQNTISLCHNDIWILRRELGDLGFTRCNRELLTQAVVVDWLESGPWTTCKACSKDVYNFLGAFNPTNFPKLNLVTLDLERFERLRSARRATTQSRRGPDIHVQSTRLSQTKYARHHPAIGLSLQRHSIHLGLLCCKAKVTPRASSQSGDRAADAGRAQALRVVRSADYVEVLGVGHD